jgi:hypothetical protein
MVLILSRAVKSTRCFDDRIFAPDTLLQDWSYVVTIGKKAAGSQEPESDDSKDIPGFGLLAPGFMLRFFIPKFF